MLPPRSSSHGSAGSAAGGGFDLQACVGAYVSAHILARKPLHWLEQDGRDIPVGVLAETGGAGDDLGIELEGGRYVEVQVKRGLNADARFWEAIDKIAEGLAEDPQLRIVLVVDPTASRPIKDDFRRSLIRYARGRTDALDQLTQRVIERVEEAGHGPTVLRRLSVQVLQVESSTDLHSRLAAQLLAGALDDPVRVIAAWDVLARDGLEMISLRGRRDRPGLVALLGSRGLWLPQHAEQPVVTPGAVPEGSPEMAVASSVQSDTPASPPEDAHWLPRFNESRELQTQGAVRSALAMLERLRREVTTSPASPRLRARIHNNMGAALMDLDRAEEAIAAFRTAAEYDPNDLTFVAHLAQAELLAGRVEEATRHARQVIESDPESTVAWNVLIQGSDTPIPEQDLPPAVQNAPVILTARALALPNEQRVASIGLLKEALRVGQRDPQLLLLIAEKLLSSLHPRPVTESAPQEVVEEIARLGAEAGRILEGTERTRMFARALVVQGAAADLAGDHDGSATLLHRAATVDPSYGQARMAAARAQMLRGNGPAALFLLDGTVEDEERSAHWHALRVASLVAADRIGELDGDVHAALAKADPDDTGTVAQALGDALIRSERFDLIAPVLELLERNERWDFLYLYRARMAARQGNQELAHREYLAAIEAVRPADVTGLQAEFAWYLYNEAEFARAADLFRESGAWAHSETAAKLYGRSLMIIGHWDEAATLIAQLRKPDEQRSWIVDIESRIALQRDDVPGALAALEHLLELEPEDVDTRLRLAETLLRVGDGQRAGEVLTALEARDDLAPDEMVSLAELLVEVGRSARALTLAYRALREYPNDPRLHVACVGVFFRAESAPASLFVRDVVTADTWLKLEADDGEELDYLILSEAPVDVRRNEMLASDQRAQPFLGLRPEDTVVLREGTATERRFRVVELKSALLHVFHDAMIGYQTRFPGRAELQSLHVGEGESFDPWPFYRTLIHSNTSAHALTDLYRQKRFPVGALADIKGRSVRRTYLHLLYDPDLPVYVEEPMPGRLENSEAEARKETVVLTATGLATLQVLGRLDLLPKMYTRILAPQSLLDELNAEIAEWDHAHDHGGYMLAGVNPDHTFTFTDVTPENISHVAEDLIALRNAVQRIAEIAPRPLVPWDAHEAEARSLLGASSYDAYVLAGEAAGLHADDWGLRWLAEHERQVTGFSTYALLCVARERGVLSGEEFHRDVTTLIALGHTFIPIDTDLLYQALSERAYHIDDVMLRLLDVLANPAVTLESAIPVAVGLLRKIALSPLGSGALGLVTAVALERISTGRELRATIRGFLSAAKSAFRLLPREHDVVRERVSAFVAAKTSELG
jgi:tetratricopeptide (TPR) repeat protein